MSVRSFAVTIAEDGVEITLTARLVPAASAAFAPLAGLDDAESSDVCCSAFAATAHELALLATQSHQLVLQHGLLSRRVLEVKDPLAAAPVVGNESQSGRAGRTNQSKHRKAVS